VLLLNPTNFEINVSLPSSTENGIKPKWSTRRVHLVGLA
jgi:hypothetical protein